MRLRVAGAGVAGLCCAYELARRGMTVTVFEAHEKLEDNQCSFLAGGMLAPWCEAESAEPLVTELGLHSIAWWSELTEVHRSGTLVVALPRDRAELSRFAKSTTRHARVDTQSLEPELENTSGVFFSGEAHLDPRKALFDLRDACMALGVQFRFGERAPDDTEVWCTGIEAPLCELRAVRGEMLLIQAQDVHISRTVRVAHRRFPLYIVPRGEGIYMLGATMIESDNPGPVTVRSTLELMGTAFALHSGFGEAVVLQSGAGLRPAFPDNLPRVEKDGGRWHVNGFYRHGFLLGPAYASRLAEEITGEAKHEGVRQRTTA